MRLLLFANGAAPTQATVERWHRPGDLIVAADGGTRHAIAAGLIPHHVIGDLDSLPPQVRARLEAAGTRFHPYPPEKDETDLELALAWAAAQGAETIVILGMWGGRPDQSVANLLLLAMPVLRGRRVIAVADGWSVRCLHGGERCHLHARPGTTLSLLPLGGAAQGVRTEGLRYPLHGETLHFGTARGVSNQFVAEEALVTLERGLLWLFQAPPPDEAPLDRRKETLR